MKKINIIRAHYWKYGGLERDAEILKLALESAGFEPFPCAPETAGPADLNIFLERLDKPFLNVLGLAPRNILYANPEQFAPAWTGSLKHLDAVLVKTINAHDIFLKLAGKEKTRFTSFSSLDRRLPEPALEPEIFCGVKELTWRNEDIVLDVYHKRKPDIKLNVVLHLNSYKLQNSESITVYPEMDDINHRLLQNKCLFHLIPSRYEGFGHLISEALSIGAIPIVLNAPPMNQIAPPGCSFYIKTEPCPVKWNSAESWLTCPDNMAYVIFNKIIPVSREKNVCREMSRRAREYWEYNRAKFERLLILHIRDILSADRREPARTPDKPAPTFNYLYVKPKAPAMEPRRPVPPLPPLSLVTRVMNRAEHLDATLSTWLIHDCIKEILIIDWNSTDGLADVLARHADPRLTWIHVPGQRYFDRARSLNLGFNLAANFHVMNADADIKIMPGFFTGLDLVGHDKIYLGGINEKGGTCILNKAVFLTLNGFNEFMNMGWGYEDTDLQARASKYYCPGSIKNNLLIHIDHGESHRTGNIILKQRSDFNGKFNGWWAPWHIIKAPDYQAIPSMTLKERRAA